MINYHRRFLFRRQKYRLEIYLLDVSVKDVSGISVPIEVGRLRYREFVQGQGKRYPTADHQQHVFFDEVDPLSVHIVSFNGDGALLSALRLTPYDIASELECFEPFLSNVESLDQCSVVLSRLVRSGSIDGARSIHHIFKYSFDYCLRHKWTRGVLHTSPRLVSLFARYGWRRTGSEFYDRYAGIQVPLFLDALDIEHLAEVKSPYIE